MNNQICAKFIGGKANGRKMIIEDCNYFNLMFCNIDWEACSPSLTPLSISTTAYKNIRYINSRIKDFNNNYLFYPENRNINDFKTIKDAYFGVRKTKFLTFGRKNSTFDHENYFSKRS